jgi:hypothetical protein
MCVLIIKVNCKIKHLIAITIVNRKIPYNTQWKIFSLEFLQLWLSQLIENSVGLPATTSKGNAPLQNTRLSATHPQYTLCFAHELPFSVVNAGQPFSFSFDALYTPIWNSL